MAIIISGSKYDPFKYEEIIRPVQSYLANVDKMDEYYTDLAYKNAQIGALIDKDRDAQAYDIYNAYNTYLNDAMESLYSEGLTPNNRARLNRIRKEGIPRITQLTSDIARREKAIEAFDKVWYGKEHDFIGYNPRESSLDDWLEGNSPDNRGLSSLELSNYVASGVKAASERAYRVFEENGYQINQVGVNQSEVATIMEMLFTGSRFDDKTAQGRYLNMIIDDVEQFVEEDVAGRYHFTNDDDFTNKFKNDIDAAINYGLFTGFTNKETYTPIKTDVKGRDGEDEDILPITTHGINIIPGPSKISPKTNIETSNSLIGFVDLEVEEPIDTPLGSSDDPATLLSWLPELNKKKDELLGKMRSYSGSMREAGYNELVREYNSYYNAIHNIRKAVPRKQRKAFDRIVEDFGEVDSAQDIIGIQQNYNNRVTQLPTISLAKPAGGDSGSLDTISANLVANIVSKLDIQNLKDRSSTPIYRMEGYSVGDKPLKAEKVRDLFTKDSGANILKMDVNADTLLGGDIPYVIVTVGGKDAGDYAVPLEYIVGGDAEVQAVIATIIGGSSNYADTTDLSSYFSKGVDFRNYYTNSNSEEFTRALNANIAAAMSDIRNVYGTAYPQTSASKSKRR